MADIQCITPTNQCCNRSLGGYDALSTKNNLRSSFIKFWGPCESGDTRSPFTCMVNWGPHLENRSPCLFCCVFPACEYPVTTSLINTCILQKWKKLVAVFQSKSKLENNTLEHRQLKYIAIFVTVAIPVVIPSQASYSPPKWVTYSVQGMVIFMFVDHKEDS